MPVLLCDAVTAKFRSITLANVLHLCRENDSLVTQQFECISVIGKLALRMMYSSVDVT